MVKYYKLLFLLFLASFANAQQSGTIKGTVSDAKTGETLIGVNIILPDGTGTTTDLDGKYVLKAPAGSIEISFRFIGYETTKKRTIVEADKPTTLNLKMKESSTTLNMVVVSASKFEQKIGEVPVSMNVLQPDLIENKNATTIESALDQVPGCTVQDGQISIRGGSGFSYGAGSRVLLMVDGLPLLAADAGDAKWNTLPMENISQVEVIKGASSVLFGSSALNGVVNLRTAYPTDKPKTKVVLFHGIYGDPVRRDSTGNRIDNRGRVAKPLKWSNENRYFSGTNFVHSRKFGSNFDFTINGAYFNDRGYKEGETEERGRLNINTRYRSKKVEGLSYGVNASHQDSKGGLYILWANADSGALRPSGGLDPETTTISYYRSTRSNIDPFVEYWDKKGNKHSFLNRWYQTNNRNNSNQSSLANSVYSEYQYQKRFNDSTTLTTGAVITRSFINAELYGDHDGLNSGVYAQFDKKWNRFTFSAGARLEYFRIDDFESSSSFSVGGSKLPFQPVVRAGMTYRAAEATFLRASYGQGFRFPSIAEKFVSTSIGPLRVFSNPDLEAETGWSGELGIKQGFKIHEWMGYFDAAFFWQQYSNMMEFTFGVYAPDSVELTNLTQVAEYSGFRSENVEDSRIAGIDISLVGKGKIFRENDMTVLAGYTYVDPVSLNADSAYRETFSNPDSDMLKYRYRHLIKADVQLDYKKFAFGGSTRYNSFMENIDRDFYDLRIPDPNGGASIPLGDVILPGLEEYRERNNKGDVVFDARVSYQVTNEAKFSFIVNNLANREYMTRPGDIQPPRTFIMQLNVQF